MELGETHCTIAEAAEYLGVSKPRVYALIREEKLQGFWDYGQRMVRTRSLKAYAKRRGKHVERESARVAQAPCSQSSG